MSTLRHWRILVKIGGWLVLYANEFQAQGGVVPGIHLTMMFVSVRHAQREAFLFDYAFLSFGPESI
jgi:hypothetical protein